MQVNLFKRHINLQETVFLLLILIKKAEINNQIMDSAFLIAKV